MEQVNLIADSQASDESDNDLAHNKSYVVDEVPSSIPTSDLPSDLPSIEKDQLLYYMGTDNGICRKPPQTP